MNKLIHYFYILSVLLTPFLSSAQSDSSAAVTVLRTLNREMISAFPILDNTVIKFDGDSIEVSKDSYKSRFNKKQLYVFDLEKEMLADVTVKVSTDNSLQLPVEGLYVTLHNEYEDDLWGYVQVSDNDGSACFKKLPVGYYTSYLTDPERRFESTTIHTAHFGDNNELYMQIKEEVRTPEILHYSLSHTAEDLFTLNIYWDHIFPVSSYTYHIYLNGEEHGQTIEKKYSISNLDVGEYEIIIMPETFYGTLHETGLSFSINQFDFMDASVETSSQQEDALPLYDLNGRIVKNATPGIYIRGGKKVIIR